MEFFIKIAFMHLFAVASPGPDFALIMRQSLKYGRVSGIWTAMGIGTGILVHVTIALLGISFFIIYQPSLFFIFKLVASLYLAILGFRSMFNRSQVTEINISISRSSVSKFKAFLNGFIVNLFNPKAFLFFITIYAILDNTVPLELKIFSGLYMAVATFIWFSFISYLTDVSSNIEKFKKIMPSLERITGVILVFISIQILFFKLPL
ncbi:MAG: LysE family transporter [SAR86 cluster bacterium]|nr:LysE family transporter [SAR86 cluster bacterium]